MLAALVGGCSNQPLREIHIAYQFRLEDDRDSLSTELKKGNYEVRLEGDCSAEDLVFTEGGVFDTEHKVDDLIQDGLRIKKTTTWRIKQEDGHRMAGCRGVVLYPDGMKVPPAPSTTTSTTEKTTTSTSTITATSPPATSPPATSPPATSPPATSPPATSPPAGVYYANCDAARAAGAAPIYEGQPGYRTALDRDRDGIACDK